MAADPPAPADDFAAWAGALRPRLHRYCARLVGSSLDGEDVVQEALAKAAMHFDAGVIQQPRAWMFRIAHHAALDHLRRRSLEHQLFSAADVDDESAADAVDPQAAAEATGAALATFMHLPLAQRAAVILADVLGHSLQEVADTLATTVPAVKAALHRGRTRLRTLVRGGELPPESALAPHLLAMAQRYAGFFNARDFDALRAMLADEVRLQVVGRVDAQGRSQASNYFGNYARLHGLQARAVVVEDRAGLWVVDADGSGAGYAIVLDADAAGRVAAIRDFRYARYVGDGLLMRAAPAAPAARG